MMQDGYQNNNDYPGTFITFEGGEGAGKTTHITFLARALREQGREVLCLHEPGGTDIGEQLRAVVLDPANKNMCDEAELLIYEAARAQIVAQVIRPALERGSVVLCDRFYDSTVAYQAYGRGLDRDFVRSANHFACKGLHPDRTVLLLTHATVEENLDRATHHGSADRLERAGLDFHERVAQGFNKMAESNPDRVRIVVSAEQKSDTAKLVFAAVADVLGWDKGNLPFNDDFFDAVNHKDTTKKASISDI